MLRSKIAEWSYYLGCASAIVAIIYRALRFGGAHLFSDPRVAPHDFMDLAVLLFVLSIASTARALVHGEGGTAAPGKVA